MWTYNYGPRTSPGDTLQHGVGHKYIKRARVNGRWKYWYEEPAKASNNNKKGTTAYETTKYGTYKKDTTFGDPDSRYGKYESVDGNKKSTLEVKKGDKWSSSTTTVRSSNYTTTVKEIGKLERSTNYAKNWLKDKLGLDEKAAVQNAQLDYNKADLQAFGAKLNFESAKEYAGKVSGSRAAEANQRIADRGVKYRDASEAAKKAESELKTAQEAYAKTPLGKLENASEKVNNFIGRVLGKKKK